MAIAATLVLLSLALAARADAFVYWTNTGSGTIGRANLDGTGVDQTFITGAGSPNAVAVDDAHVYWTNAGSGAIGRANLDGTGVDQSFITEAGQPRAVAVDDAHVYWRNTGSGTIGRANLDGAGVDQSFITGTGTPPTGQPSNGVGVAVDDDHVYWARAGVALLLGTTRIGRADRDGTNVDHAFLPDLLGTSCGQIAVGGARVYSAFVGLTGGVVRSVRLDGSGADWGISAPACGVAIDATHVYWATGAVGRAKLDGTGVEPSFITGVGATGVAVDALSELPLPSNAFSFGKVTKSKKRGTATLTVRIEAGPGALRLTGTKRVRPKVKRAAAGDVKLPITPRGAAKRQLREKGRATVRGRVTYTPDGGSPNRQSKRIKLVRR